MIDRSHELPLTGQAKALGISRGSVYYLARPTSDADLVLMRRIDELHLEHPFAGSRMLRDMLKAEGREIGRRHVATLMRRMGVEAIYRRPNTSKLAPGHRIYPYLLRMRRAVRKSATVAAGEARCGRRNSRPPLPSLQLEGGREDHHRGHVAEGSSGLCGGHEPAGGRSAFQHLSRQRPQDAGVLGASRISAHRPREAAEAGRVHRDHRRLARGGSRVPPQAAAHGQAGVRPASR